MSKCDRDAKCDGIKLKTKVKVIIKKEKSIFQKIKK